MPTAPSKSVKLVHTLAARGLLFRANCDCFIASLMEDAVAAAISEGLVVCVREVAPRQIEVFVLQPS